MAELIGAPAAVGRRSGTGLAVLGGITVLLTLLTLAAAGVRPLRAKLDTDVVGDAEIGGARTRLSHSE